MYKNKCGCLTQIGQYFWIAAMTLLSFCLLQGSVRAQEAICAEVKIVIDQKLSFERQAFDAKMVINNGLDSQVVENVNVELLFTDANGQPVVATQDPNASNATFFYRTDSLSGIASTEGNGRVEPKSSAEVHWMIIPAAGSVDSNSALYYVGAKVSYTLDGIQTEVAVTPEYIIVKPLPKLSLDYFLPADVYADDPFTDEVEPQVPFTLGVRVSNSGFGDSPNTVIESAQPKIVENKQNLLVGFDILGSYISDVPAGKSLLLNFDTIAAGTAKVGRWRMVTALSGRFIEFNARFTHADELGGALTALLERVTTHTLIHDVKVDLPGRDTIRDFLALDSDSYRVYESDGIDTEVIDRSQEAQLVNRSDKGVVKFTPVAGFVYAKMDEPYQGRAIPIKAVRSDGKVLPAENLWLSKRFNDNLTWSYYLNLFDVESTGEYVFEWAQEPKTKLSGKVYEDTNNNGMQDPNEQGIGAVGVTLSGIDDKGTYLSLVGYTNRSGVFAFNDLHSGIYSLEVASVASMNDGVAKAGGAGGNASPGKIEGIQLVSGIESEDYLFAKRYGSTINPEGATLSGSVYLDANNNGLFDENESGLDSVAVALSGTSYEGNVIYRETLTGALGSFTFSGLSHGLYSLAVQPIAGMTDGIATPGDAGGIATLGLIKDITLTEASNGQGYLLAKRSESEPDLRSDLVLSVYDSSKAKPAVNKEITLHWTVKNLGPDSAPETKLKIALPASVTLIKADSGYKDGVWRVGELLSQQSKTLRLTIVANDLSSDVLFSGVATSTRHDADNANNTATLLWKGRAAAKTDLQISFDHSSTKVPLSVGEQKILFIKAKNNGPDTAFDISANIVLPDDLKLFRYTAWNNSKFTEGKWSIDSLASGESVSLWLTTEVLSLDNDITVKANILHSHGSDTNLTNNVSSLYWKGRDNNQTDLSVHFRHYGSHDVNTSFIVDLAVANSGPDSAFNTTATIELPTQVTLIKAPSNCTFRRRVGTCRLNELKKSLPSYLYFTLHAKSLAGNPTLKASVKAQGKDLNLANNNATLVLHSGM